MSNQALLKETGLDDVQLREALDQLSEIERQMITQNRHRIGGGSTHDISGFFF